MINEKRDDIVLELYNHIQKEELHFNELEKGYRLLASQWLLASLAGIGFLLKDEKIILADNFKTVLIGAIGLFSNLGIFLLWIIDVKVYHKLLNCAFLQGVKLEQENDWLPKIRTDMLLSQETGDVVRSTGLFYIGSCSLLMIVAVIAFSVAYHEYIWLILISGIALLFTQVIYMIKNGKNKRAAGLYRKLKANYVDDVI